MTSDQPQRRPRGRPRMRNSEPQPMSTEFHATGGFDKFSPITRAECERHNAISHLMVAQRCLLDAQEALIAEGRQFDIVDGITRIESDVVNALRSYRETVWKEEHP